MTQHRPRAEDREALGREITAAFGRLPEVVAVALAGSRVSGAAEIRSDLDLYVYAPEPPSLAARAQIAAGFSPDAEIGNDFWEPGDEWVDEQTGIGIDVMYRSPVWIETQLDRVLVQHQASLGYSTCFWSNVLHSRALVDAVGWYARLQAAAAGPYPAPLKHAIVARNHSVLRQTISSYRHQLGLAVGRADAVSVQTGLRRCWPAISTSCLRSTRCRTPARSACSGKQRRAAPSCRLALPTISKRCSRWPRRRRARPYSSESTRCWTRLTICCDGSSCFLAPTRESPILTFVGDNG